MSNLSFENIDRWLFEYTEGNLSNAQVEQLQNFIFLHPELNIDLEAWKSARVEKDNVAFDAIAYQQSAPFFGVLWTTAGVGFFLLAIAYSLTPTSFSIDSKYQEKQIDVAFIQDIDSDSDFSVGPTQIAAASGIKPIEGSSRNIAQQSSAKETHVTKRQAYSNKNNFSSSSDFTQSSHSKNKQTDVKNTENPNEPSLVDAIVEQLNQNDQMENHKKAPKLDDVVASLSHEANTSDEKLVAEKKSYTYKGKNMTLKKRFSSMARQLKRMADQPVALRNSKDPHFHAPFMTGFNSNFGMVGTLMRNRFQTTTRNQWVGHDNQQLMNIISWDNYIYPLRGGLGVDISYSTYGNGGLENYNAAITYSPKFSLSNNVSLEPAMRFKTGMINLDNQSSIIGRDIEFRRQQVQSVFSDGETPIGSQLWYRDMGVGMLLNTKWFYAGINLDNVHRHYNNYHSADLNEDHRASHHLTSVIGTEYTPKGRDITYSAYLLHQKFGELNELWVGGNIQWNWLQIGAGMNHHSDFGASFGLTFDQFSLLYNIDYIESRLFDTQLLSHQITMRVLMRPNRFAAKYLLK